MVPLLALKALPWKLIGYGVAALAVVALGWRVHAWREAYKSLPDLQAALAAEVKCAAGSQCEARQKALEAEQAAKAAEVVAGYERELEELRSRPAVRRVIRVCADPNYLPGSGASGPADGTGPASGVVHGETEFDVAPLFDLAREADEVAARLRALQDWNRSLSQVPREPREQQ